eukprot:NODE_8_length_66115_cov_0.981823.p17 type:complete len:388 gc:universal NODE_8_length_66115_cov_0.981823:12082-10919(-)
MKPTLAFFICGIINNIIYVIFLSAASDIFHGLEGLVLVADIVPGLFSKSISPYIEMSYDMRFRICVVLSISALLLNTFSNVDASLSGVVLASFSSGLGEASFLALSSQFPKDITGWFSGTGMAGLGGSFLYFLLTTVFRLTKAQTMLLISPFPLLLYFAYHFGLRRGSLGSVESSSVNLTGMKMETISDKLRIVSKAVIPFMLPLFLVYYSEYVINQGILPTIVFDVSEDSFFKSNRDYYVVFQMLYQVGVFLSRSSVAFYTIPHHKYLFILAGLQFINVFLFIGQSLDKVFGFIPVCLFVLYEGLLGGSTYANAFACLLKFDPVLEYEVLADEDDISQNSASSGTKNVKEFLMGAVSLADTFGITCAGFSAILIAPWLCEKNGMHC